MYRKTVLDSGIRITSERVPHCRTVAVGIWVDVGSRDEHDLNNGCCHFIEHMLFKGTGKRSPQQIAIEFDMLGGASNAFTSRENTCYYATVLDNHLEALVDLLADMFLNSLFDREELLRERQVILQEISMVEDQPDDLIHDLFFAQLWGRHPLGKPVLGTREVVASMDPKKLLDHVNTYYLPGNVLISAAGSVDHDRFVELWERRLRGIRRDGGTGNGLVRRPPVELDQPVRRVYAKPLEQVHAVLGTYGLPQNDEDRFVLLLLNVLLGGNMSSRLFQEIRENRGLAYSIYSYVDSFVDSGMLGIYLGVDAETLNESLEVVAEQVGRLAEEAVPEQELANAREFARGGLYISAENMESRMTRNARNEFCFDRYFSYEETAAALDRVTAEDVHLLAKRLFLRPLTAAVVGPMEPHEVRWGGL
ncbi:MAG: pitrilysin family protein [Thermodesulfobacteriota bacterium]